MTKEKGWGHTVLGWFVVKDGASEGDVAPEAPAADAPPADAPPAPSAPEPVREPPRPTAGAVDFPGVFDAYGLAAEERDRFDKAADLLRNLPEGTDPAVKKQIVGASLKAFGVPIEKIIETGVEEIQALDGYQKKQAADTQKLADEAEKKVAAFQSEIARIRQVAEEAVKEQTGLLSACNQKKLEVQKVLEFFGQEAVARVVRESPRLVDPAAPPKP